MEEQLRRFVARETGSREDRVVVRELREAFRSEEPFRPLAFVDGES